MDLLRFSTRDGIELHGVLHTASRSFADPSALQPENFFRADAAVFLHGAAGNFYGSALLAGLLPTLLKHGVSVFATNTRGHDLVTTLRTPQGGKRGGAAYETVDECRHDVHGAVDLLANRGFNSVALIGHSLGAVKAIYSQAVEPHAAISHVVAISPPRFSYQAYCDSARGSEFRSAMREAEESVAGGRSLRLIEATVPLPLLITAAGYIDKYGPSERYDILQHSQQVTCPSLYVFGQNELNAGHPAFTGLDAALRERAKQAANRIDVATIASADHFYTGQHEALCRQLASWSPWR